MLSLKHTSPLSSCFDDIVAWHCIASHHRIDGIRWSNGANDNRAWENTIRIGSDSEARYALYMCEFLLCLVPNPPALKTRSTIGGRSGM